MPADELRLRVRVSPRYHDRLRQHLEAVEPRARGFELLRLAAVGLSFNGLQVDEIQLTGTPPVDPAPDSPESGTGESDWAAAGSSVGSNF